MTLDEAQKFAVQFLAGRDPELGDSIMRRVQEGEISDDDEAYSIALAYVKFCEAAQS